MTRGGTIRLFERKRRCSPTFLLEGLWASLDSSIDRNFIFPFESLHWFPWEMNPPQVFRCSFFVLFSIFGGNIINPSMWLIRLITFINKVNVPTSTTFFIIFFQRKLVFVMWLMTYWSLKTSVLVYWDKGLWNLGILNHRSFFPLLGSC